MFIPQQAVWQHCLVSFSLRGSCFCTHEESSRAVQTVTWVNLPVNQKNRLLGDIKLLYLVACRHQAVSLDADASLSIPVYLRVHSPVRSYETSVDLSSDADKKAIIQYLYIHCEINKLIPQMHPSPEYKQIRLIICSRNNWKMVNWLVLVARVSQQTLIRMSDRMSDRPYTLI